MKKKKYNIISYTYPNDGTSFNSFEELFDEFVVFEISSDFKIIDNFGTDHTSEFKSFLKMANFQLLPRDSILKFIPQSLQDLMDERWDEDLKLNIGNKPDDWHFGTLRTRLIRPEDIKSPEGFKPVWEKGFIIIGKVDQGNYLLLKKADEKDTKIYFVDADEASNLNPNNLMVVWDSIDDFIDSIKKIR